MAFKPLFSSIFGIILLLIFTTAHAAPDHRADGAGIAVIVIDTSLPALHDGLSGNRTPDFKYPGATFHQQALIAHFKLQRESGTVTLWRKGNGYYQSDVCALTWHAVHSVRHNSFLLS